MIPNENKGFKANHKINQENKWKLTKILVRE